MNSLCNKTEALIAITNFYLHNTANLWLIFNLWDCVWCAKHFIMGYIFSSDASKNIKPLFQHPCVIQS